MKTTTNKRITGTTLQNRRRQWFQEYPLCVHCVAAGRVTLATELDHVVPLFKGGADDETNLQGLCAEHHKAKTAIDMGHTYTPRKTIGLDGWPI